MSVEPSLTNVRRPVDASASHTTPSRSATSARRRRSSLPGLTGLTPGPPWWRGTSRGCYPLADRHLSIRPRIRPGVESSIRQHADQVRMPDVLRPRLAPLERVAGGLECDGRALVDVAFDERRA